MPGFLVGVGKAGDVAERSPAVISANLKEDMLLQKKLVVLNRSERSVVHQIKVDQKVMYKRFQARLTCSKLAHARLMGQRELQMQLRAKSLGSLNTDIAGNSDEDYVFLQKLEQRPCTSSSFSHMAEHSRPSSKTKSIKSQSESGFENKEEVTSRAQKGRSSSARARYLKDNLGVNISVRPEMDWVVPAIVRPATTLGTRVQDEFERHQVEFEEKVKATLELEKDKEAESVENASMSGSESTVQVGDNIDSLNEVDSPRSDMSDGKVNSKPSVAFLEHLDIGEACPKTAADVTQWNYSIPSSPTSPKQISRRASRAADFFQAEEKIDLVALRLQEAKTYDFTENVQKFCEELEEMKCARANPDIDYYSMRLQMSLNQANSKSLVKVPGTPDDENKRSIGNIFVRSLTLPTLNIDNK